jgi:hypothetical protein
VHPGQAPHPTRQGGGGVGGAGGGPTGHARQHAQPGRRLHRKVKRSW